MDNEKKYIGRKVVDVFAPAVCYTPKYGPFKGEQKNMIVSTGSIKYLLRREAKVTEILSDGTEVELNEENYNLWLDEGEMPIGDYTPEIPERPEEETEEPTDPETPEEPGEGNGETDPEEPTDPKDPEDIDEEKPGNTEDGSEEDGETEKPTEEDGDNQDDILDNMPDGLTPDEEERWLEDNLL